MKSEVRVEGTFSFISKSVLENVLAELVERWQIAILYSSILFVDLKKYEISDWLLESF